MNIINGILTVIGTICTGAVILMFCLWMTGPSNPLGWNLAGANDNRYATLNQCNEARVIIESAGFEVGECYPDLGKPISTVAKLVKSAKSLVE